MPKVQLMQPAGFEGARRAGVEGPMLGFEQHVDRLFTQVISEVLGGVLVAEEWGGETRFISWFAAPRRVLGPRCCAQTASKFLGPYLSEDCLCRPGARSQSSGSPM